eukprot:SRR837773.5613.p1 GENE.SRR837773.5613~~SRR837773.5613.p1  ORF type:complete len:468 (+),score=185.73 SRR837773.5613:80-1405(+)
MEEVANSGVVDLILMSVLAKSRVNLGKALTAKTGRVTRLQGVPKLEDANDAGGKNSAECTLILTEGDSAKTLAVAGLSVIGRDKYGVFPLRGKLLNVRDATLKQMMDNEEIQSIIKIVGLDLNKQYDEELKGLRYGSIMIMADQDHDGSHIKGLIINLIHAWWPSLARLPNFLKEFFTPIVKAFRGKSAISFYTMPEYEAWKEETSGGKGYRIKYYKGLGTSTASEAKEYFNAIEKHRIQYKYTGPEDDKSIDLAFNKKRADDRKEWMVNHQENLLIDHTQTEVTYADFVNKEFVLYCKANVIRSIPSMIDGFKAESAEGLVRLLQAEVEAGHQGRAARWLRWGARRLSPRRDVAVGDDRRHGPGLCGLQQHQPAGSAGPVRYPAAGRKRLRLRTLHLHTALAGDAADFPGGRRQGPGVPQRGRHGHRAQVLRADHPPWSW